MSGKGKQFLARILTTGCTMLAFSAALHAQCGKERWPVKTLQDADAARAAALTPAKTTVTQLLANVAPAKLQLLKAESTRFPAEEFTYQVEVLILGFKKESDSDFHIVISDPKNPAKTMISEIPSGACTNHEYQALFNSLQAQFIKQVGNPLPKYKKLAKPIPATFTGLGFFDFLHGQTGVAPNGFELHPVIKFEVHQ